MGQPELSIVIPAWNEESCIGRTLESILAVTEHRGDTEIVVSVSGNDRTADIADSFPVIVCRSEKGRAVQMNNGTAKCSGRILYFLHADTIPPATFCDDIIDGALHEECLFRQRIMFAFQNFFERSNRLRKRNVNSFSSSKLFRYEVRLRKEFLNFTGTSYEFFVRFR